VRKLWQRRAAKGVTIGINHTWSHCINDAVKNNARASFVLDADPVTKVLPLEYGTRSFEPECLPGVMVHVLGPSRLEPGEVEDVVLGAFMAISWIADYWATHATSRAMQYIGLGLYVLAEALIFVPLLFIVALVTQDILAKGGYPVHPSKRGIGLPPPTQ